MREKTKFELFIEKILRKLGIIKTYEFTDADKRNYCLKLKRMNKCQYQCATCIWNIEKE